MKISSFITWATIAASASAKSTYLRKLDNLETAEANDALSVANSTQFGDISYSALIEGVDEKCFETMENSINIFERLESFGGLFEDAKAMLEEQVSEVEFGVASTEICSSLCASGGSHHSGSRSSSRGHHDDHPGVKGVWFPGMVIGKSVAATAAGIVAVIKKAIPVIKKTFLLKVLFFLDAGRKKVYLVDEIKELIQEKKSKIQDKKSNIDSRIHSKLEDKRNYIGSKLEDKRDAIADRLENKYGSHHSSSSHSSPSDSHHSESSRYQGEVPIEDELPELPIEALTDSVEPSNKKLQGNVRDLIKNAVSFFEGLGILKAANVEDGVTASSKDGFSIDFAALGKFVEDIRGSSEEEMNAWAAGDCADRLKFMTAQHLSSLSDEVTFCPSFCA